MRQKIDPLLQPTITDNLPPPPLKVAPKVKTKNILIAVIIGVLLCSTSALAYYAFVQKPQTPPIVTISPTPAPITPIATPTIITTPAPTVEDSKFGVLTWLSSPQKVNNPDIIQSPKEDMLGYLYDDLGTYKVGEFSKGGELLVALFRPDGPSNKIPFRLIQSNNKFYLIESLINDNYLKKELGSIFDSQKVELISYPIKELFPEPGYLLNQEYFQKSESVFMSPIFSTELKDFSVFASTPEGIMLTEKEPIPDYSGIFTKTFYLKLKDSTIVPYRRQTALASTDNKIPVFNNLDGSTNKFSFSVPQMGCGGGNYEFIIDSSLVGERNLVGRNNSGLEIFRVNKINSLVNYLYSQYKTGRDYPSAPPILSIEQFNNTNSYIIFQEKNGDWILLVNSEYAMMAECGKPVIYLYPQKDTQVSVKVGADITLSEPLYPQDGWTVLAHPDGQLEYQGLTYPNLFWEGLGWGFYPDTGNRGFVVSQKELVATLKNHLSLLGLNRQESADFLEFWLPKMPATPYIRLTWLDTKEMNQLAPLSVLPHPDTVIRIFLDFTGLDKPVSLIPQKLTAPPRRGFTLVEWGGLLLK